MNNNELIITRPGKFEGEPRYVPDFWGRALEGFADEDDCSVFGFYITKEDSEKYPELKVGQLLELREDENGFVFSKIVNK